MRIRFRVRIQEDELRLFSSECRSYIRSKLQGDVSSVIDDVVLAYPLQQGRSCRVDRLVVNLGALSVREWTDGLSMRLRMLMKSALSKALLGNGSGLFDPAVAFFDDKPREALPARFVSSVTAEILVSEDDAMSCDSSLDQWWSFIKDGYLHGGERVSIRKIDMDLANLWQTDARFSSRLARQASAVPFDGAARARLRRSSPRMCDLFAKRRLLADLETNESDSQSYSEVKHSTFDSDNANDGTLSGQGVIGSDDAAMRAGLLSMDARIAKPGKQGAMQHVRGSFDARARALGRMNDETMQVIFSEGIGVVTLWPLLSSFFEHVGCPMHPRAERDVRAMAACCLDILVFGEAAWCESRMPLHKVLCGIRPDTVLPEWEADDAVLAKIEGWAKCLPQQMSGWHQCSVSDIRALFLRRAGTLQQHNGCWNLSVTSEASDVLLGTCPWPIGCVLLPWMNMALQVDWPLQRY